MKEETVTIIKTSALQGIHNKYQGTKDCLMADIVSLLEAPAGGDVSRCLEEKIEELSHVEAVLVQITSMFGPSEAKEQECCSK